MGIVKLSLWIFNRHNSSFYRKNLIQNGRAECTEHLNLKACVCIFLNLSFALPWFASKYLSFSVPRVLRSPSFSYTLFSFIYLLWSFCLVSPFVKLYLSVYPSLSLGFSSYCFVVACVPPPSLALLISLVAPTDSSGLALFQCINGIETYPEIYISHILFDIGTMTSPKNTFRHFCFMTPLSTVVVYSMFWVLISECRNFFRSQSKIPTFTVWYLGAFDILYELHARTTLISCIFQALLVFSGLCQ